MTDIPLATYRVQFNPLFGFQKARAIVPYLTELGISHIYASPIFKARKGSTHGYDVVDPNQLNPELGTLEEFHSMQVALRNAEMGWLQDIVPNHMAFDSQNHMLMDVLENGQESQYYRFFDIEWDHPYENMKGRVLVPLLGKLYAECLENGEMQLRYDEEGLSINYYDVRLPLKIESYAEVFEHNLDILQQRFGTTNPDLMKFLGGLNLFKSLPSKQRKTGREEQIRHAKRMLWHFYRENETIKQFIDDNIAFFNGKKGNPRSFDALDKLISVQLFRLSFWKVAAEEINYRRFFTVNDLICLRVENEEVFDYAHNLIFRLLGEGKFNGLRIDHIDGLYDPTAYLKRLRDKRADLYIVVEKILDFQEELPLFWPVQGTTGYDFMNHVNGIFCNRDNSGKFSRIYYKFTRMQTPYDDLLAEKKRLIIEKHMAGNIDNLAQFMKNISSKDRYGKDITLHGLKRALIEVMVFFPVYRTYVHSESLRPPDQANMKRAIQKAEEKNPGLMYELDFIENFLLLQDVDSLDDKEKQQRVEVVMHFQLYASPLMAKGFEDTVLYIYNRLISLNEVGGDPSKFGITVDQFHEHNQKQVGSFPHSLNATSTHDTKRGEDARARINVLGEIPQEWDYYLRKWSRINRCKKRKLAERRIPDENDEYFLYQTLIGAFPFEESGQDFTDRIKHYIIKAVREAKVHTAWIKPDVAYEQAYLAFVEDILRPCKENRFLREFLPFQRKIAHYGIFNSLSQTLLKITSPGVPDFYQGTELWDLNLVDPDNRRPVDFEKRALLLQHIKNKIQSDILGLTAELLSSKEDGSIKLFLIYKALQARREHVELFQNGSYIPIPVEGRFKNHVLAFARNHNNAWAITVAPRLLTAVIKQGDLPLGQKIWDDTHLVLSNMPGSWENAFSQQMVKGRQTLLVGDVLEHFPVALLIGKEEI